MIGETAVLGVIDALQGLQIPYMLVGSMASNLYGVPRSTQDAYFVLQLGNHSILELAKQLGPSFQVDSQQSFETITGTSRYIVKMAAIPFIIELFLLSEDAHDKERFARWWVMPTLGRDVFVPTAEDMIITKLRWSQRGKRPKDVDDVRNMLAVQGDQIDWPYVYGWCDRQGTRDLLDEIRRSIPLI